MTTRRHLDRSEKKRLLHKITQLKRQIKEFKVCEQERLLIQSRQTMASQILEILNLRDDYRNKIRNIIKIIRTCTGFESVGIRINNGKDYPYLESTGFGESFLSSENSLLDTDLFQGEKDKRESTDDFSLHCLCGQIIGGTIDRSLPFMTPMGSFWTNHASQILNTSPQIQSIPSLRMRCMMEGYESIALIPLLSNKKTIGLLQINDHRKDIFDLEFISFFEGIGASIGIALEHEQAETAMRKNEEKYRSLLQNMRSCVAIYSVRDNGNTFVFEEVNHAVEQVEKISKQELIGRTLNDVFPFVEPFGLLDVFKRVWKTGRPEHHPITLYKDDRISGWRENEVYRLSSGEIVAIYDDMTGKKQAEEKILEQNAFLSNVIESLAHPFLVIDVNNYRIKMANKAAGFEINEAVCTCHQLTHGQDKPCIEEDFVCPVREIKRTKQPVISEHTHLTANGEKKFVEVHAHPIFDRSGTLIQIIEYTLDITSRKMAQTALAESEKRYRELVDNALVGIFKSDFQGNILYGNDALVQILEINSPESPSLDSILLRFRYKGREGPFFRVIKEHGRVNNFEVTISTWKQNTKHLMISAIMEDGIISGMAMDVTQKKQAEKEILMLKQAVMSITDSLYITDMQDRIVFINEAFCQMYGYSKDEIIGQSSHVLWKKKPENEIDNRDIAFFEQYNWENEYIDVRKDGSEFPIFLSVSNVKNEDDEDFAIVRVTRDITDRKRYENILQQFSFKDGLTGIANRRRFDITLDIEWNRAVRRGLTLSAIMADIDYFKQFNDLYGHQSGDDCLEQVARTIESSLCRSGDLAARYGGEEFVILLPECPLNDAIHLADTIKSKIEALQIPHTGSLCSDVVTISLGVYNVYPKPWHPQAMLIKNTDQALYKAKLNGRNQVAFIEHDIHNR